MVVDWLAKWGVPLKSARTVCVGGFYAYKGQVTAMAAIDTAVEPYDREAEITGVPVECLGAVISGNNGTGKTTLTAYALRLYAEKGLRSALYIPFNNMLNRISEKRFSSLIAPLVLVIDDFNLHAGVDKFASSVMSVLSARAAKGRPTFVTTSAPRAAMRNWAGGGFASWAAGSGVYIELQGNDINKTVKQKQIKEQLEQANVRRTKKKIR